MCYILSRLLLSVVKSLFLCVLCVNIYFMRYFSHFLLLYIDVCFFVDFFITKLYSSLLFFKIYSKNHYLLFCWKAFISMCFFLFFFFFFLSQTIFHTFFFTEKCWWRFLVILYIFHIQYWFSDYFLFHCIICVVYIQHWHLVRTENTQRIDLYL